MGVAKDGLASADHLGEDFYKVLLEQEPFKSTTVRHPLYHELLCTFVLHG
jgi:hypothetical protein